VDPADDDDDAGQVAVQKVAFVGSLCKLWVHAWCHYPRSRRKRQPKTLNAVLCDDCELFPDKDFSVDFTEFSRQGNSRESFPV
jgi:hypothetical protein